MKRNHCGREPLHCDARNLTTVTLPIHCVQAAARNAKIIFLNRTEIELSSCLQVNIFYFKKAFITYRHTTIDSYQTCLLFEFHSKMTVQVVHYYKDFMRKKYFAGTRIRTHDLSTHVLCLGISFHYLPLHFSDQTLSPYS